MNIVDGLAGENNMIILSFREKGAQTRRASQRDGRRQPARGTCKKGGGATNVLRWELWDSQRKCRGGSGKRKNSRRRNEDSESSCR